MKEGTRVLVALGSAIAAGALIGASGNTSLVHAADAIAPIGTVWVNGIRMTVIPLVVALLVTGVASASDVRAIGRLGGRTLLVFWAMLISIATLVIPLAAFLLTLVPPNVGGRPQLPPGAAEAAGQIASGGQTQTLAAWLTSLIPTNVVAAAANGAMVPLILFTLLFALAVARSSPASRSALLGVSGALSEAMLTMVRWIVALAPIGVFALVLPLAAHAGGTLAGAIGSYIAAYSVGCVAVILLLYPIVALFGRVPVRAFARAALPPQLIAFSSSSSIASLPALVESAEVELRLPTSVTGFVLPLAVSTFKIAGPVSWTMGALFVSWFYGVPLHARELATVAFSTVFLTFGVPGIPRGAFIMLTPLFSAIGLPVEGIGILIAVDALPDLFATTLNVTGDLAAATIIARVVGNHAAPETEFTTVAP